MFDYTAFLARVHRVHDATIAIDSMVEAAKETIDFLGDGTPDFFEDGCRILAADLADRCSGVLACFHEARGSE